MGKQIRWLWENMDKPYQKRHIIALCVCVITCALLLVNPALSRRLIDEVIVAQNPDPLMDILMLMLAVKLGREGMRYLMVIFLEKASQNVMFNLRRRLFATIHVLEAENRNTETGKPFGILIRLMRTGSGHGP